MTSVSTINPDSFLLTGDYTNITA